MITAGRPPRLISNMRGVRYGEVLVAYARNDGIEAEVYGTQMLNDCPQELWSTLDASAIAREMGAVMVKLNGPRHWTLDGFGTKVAVVEPVFREFNGLKTRRIATINLGGSPGAGPYTERHVNAALSSSGTPASLSTSSSAPTASPTSCRPTASASWAKGDRQIWCVAFRRDGTLTNQSFANNPQS